MKERIVEGITIGVVLILFGGLVWFTNWRADVDSKVELIDTLSTDMRNLQSEIAELRVELRSLPPEERANIASILEQESQ